MSKHKSVERVDTDLEIDEHLPLQERGWKVQAIGLYLILVLVLTAAAGLYGDGLLSKERESKNNATLEYQKFYRLEARMELKVELSNSGGTEGIVLSFPAAYLKHFQVGSIFPEPDKNIIKGDQVQYLFNGAGNAIITFYLTPLKIGKITGSIEVDDTRFALNHFIFP